MRYRGVCWALLGAGSKPPTLLCGIFGLCHAVDIITPRPTLTTGFVSLCAPTSYGPIWASEVIIWGCITDKPFSTSSFLIEDPTPRSPLYLGIEVEDIEWKLNWLLNKWCDDYYLYGKGLGGHQMVKHRSSLNCFVHVICTNCNTKHKTTKLFVNKWVVFRDFHF